MTFVNLTHLVMAHRNKNCLESLELSSGKLETFFGTCSQEAVPIADLRITLSSVTGVCSDGNDHMYISLSWQKTVILIDTKTRFAQILKKLDLDPIYLHFHEASQRLLMTVYHGLAALSLDGTDFTLITGSEVETGNVTGKLEDSRFTYPGGLAMLDSTTIIIADEHTNRYFNIN